MRRLQYITLGERVDFMFKMGHLRFNSTEFEDNEGNNERYNYR